MSIRVKAFPNHISEVRTVQQEQIDAIITAHLRPIFGFALKRCRSLQDAEDLTQEIMLRVFRALRARNDIADVERFIRTVAHNCLCNYYRDTARHSVGIPLDEVAEVIADPDAEVACADDDHARIARLGQEIAYLSKLQRRIVIAYYFENRRQTEIAQMLDLPLGTVKWHLFEARRELKKGINTMRETSELKFRPIRFHSYGFNGEMGKKSPDEFFRSTLVQNICYCVRREAMTVNEIADALGVSPVYVEAEVEALLEERYLCEQKGRYLCNFLINEPTAELLTMQDKMYRTAATHFAPKLCDALRASGLLNDPDILCAQSEDRENFLLWTLIPYITAWSGEGSRDDRIKFDEVATIRPDGGHNILHAAVLDERMVLPDDYLYMTNWCGPMWNGVEDMIHWQIDSAWSARGGFSGFRIGYDVDVRRVLALYRRSKTERLSCDEYAWLAERGYLRMVEGEAVWQIVILRTRAVRARLLALGDAIRQACAEPLAAIKAPYVEAMLAATPPHMRRVRAFELQFLFHSDGYFLLHCLEHLLACGRMHTPRASQRQALTTLIVEQA